MIPQYEIDYSKYENECELSILLEYKNPDAYVLLNEDKHLHPVWIKLPYPTDITKIRNFGLPAKKQKYWPDQLPRKLVKLVEQSATVEDIWLQLEENQHLYQAEIEFIRQQWDIYQNGVWYFINGKPTFIDGWHHIYCSWWRFKDGKQPDYRDRNRKFYHGLKYAYTTKETLTYNEQGKIVYENPELRIPVMKQTGFRTCLGVSYPKHRKDGASNMCLCAEYMEVITHRGVVGGIISMTGEHAKQKLFDEIMIPAWNQMPFFFKPRSTSNQNPNKQIVFNSERARANKLNTQSLGSLISYSETSESTLYDGGNNIWINTDETGKTTNTDTYLRHKQLKPCVSLGNGANIFGFLTYPSTVGEMEGTGGKNFFRICQESRYESRDISGQTPSGMFVYYMPAYEGLEGFIGEYGESVVDTPTREQAKYIGKTYGAKEYLENKRAQLLALNDIEGYNEEVRLFPTAYMECFRTTDGDVGFNTKKVNERIEEITAFKPNVRRGNFKWVDDTPDTFVYFEDDPNGRFYLSKILDESETNRWFKQFVNGEYHRFPVETKFIAAADPYKFEVTKGSRMSKGGGAVFWDYDESIDRDVPIEQWRSYKFVCTYLARPAKREDYCEDMLMMCVYFGAMMNPEIDVNAIWTHFESRGYGGFLYYEIDPVTNKKSVTPGFNSRTGKKQKIFDLNRDYIELHAHRCDHLDILGQWKDITSIDEMTDYDLIPCTGGCLMAAKGPRVHNPYRPNEEEPKEEVTGGLTAIYPAFNYES